MVTTSRQMLVMLAACRQLRYAHTSETQVVPAQATKTHIYNTPAREDVMKNWKPQVPGGPIHDGWAMSTVPFRGDRPSFFFKMIAFVASAFWLPFFLIQYQLKKANRG